MKSEFYHLKKDNMYIKIKNNGAIVLNKVQSNWSINIYNGYIIAFLYDMILKNKGKKVSPKIWYKKVREIKNLPSISRDYL